MAERGDPHQIPRMIKTHVSALLALTGIAAALCLSTACNRDQKKVIAVIPKGRAHLFWQSVHAGAAKACAGKQCQHRVERPDRGDGL